MTLRYSLHYRCWILRAPWFATLYNRDFLSYESRAIAVATMAMFQSREALAA